MWVPSSWSGEASSWMKEDSSKILRRRRVAICCYPICRTIRSPSCQCHWDTNIGWIVSMLLNIGWIVSMLLLQMISRCGVWLYQYLVFNVLLQRTRRPVLNLVQWRDDDDEAIFWCTATPFPNSNMLPLPDFRFHFLAYGRTGIPTF